MCLSIDLPVEPELVEIACFDTSLEVRDLFFLLLLLRLGIHNCENTSVVYQLALCLAPTISSYYYFCKLEYYTHSCE